MDECFMVGDKSNDTRINRTKQLLKWFIEQKSRWNTAHEFAIMILGEMAVWHMDFTTDTVLLSHAIDELYTMGKFPAFDSTSMFKEILIHSDLDDDDDSTIRAIMIYTRSDVLPSLPDREILDTLHLSGRFFYDCIYIHQKASEVAGPIKPQMVYDRLTEMEDQDMPGYYYELTKMLKKFCSAMGELLAHPRVRPLQDELSSKMQLPPKIPVTYKSPDIMSAEMPSSKSTDIFGNPKRSSMERERERTSSRAKDDTMQSYPGSGNMSVDFGNNKGSPGSGNGTGKDDAILI
ncbi:Component of the BRCA1-A complex [Mortierella sp. NVP85]|nr:Component of the BRCA1-A complex [Mortierella sp. NVP85]